jgi:hypothetical protein
MSEQLADWIASHVRRRALLGCTTALLIATP